MTFQTNPTTSLTCSMGKGRGSCCLRRACDRCRDWFRPQLHTAAQHLQLQSEATEVLNLQLPRLQLTAIGRHRQAFASWLLVSSESVTLDLESLV